MNEGIEIPKKGTITVLDPFMRKNGFYDANGWWLLFFVFSIVIQKSIPNL